MAQDISAELSIRPFSPHVLRASTASHLSLMGVAKDTIAKILNHTEGGTTAGYVRHGYTNEKQVALERWADRLIEIVEGRTGKVTRVNFG